MLAFLFPKRKDHNTEADTKYPLFNTQARSEAYVTLLKLKLKTVTNLEEVLHIAIIGTRM